ncbi:hypothetical protein R6Q57_017415 [Mikania cordata]
MEGSCIVDAFSKVTNKRIFYTMCFVWVHFIWTDVNKNRLLLILLDQHRMKMTAIVPEHLIHLYNDMEFVGATSFVVDVVGKIIMGERLKYQFTFMIFLQDATEHFEVYGVHKDCVNVYIKIHLTPKL